MNKDDDPVGRGYASPPCFMHEMDPRYFGLAVASDLEGSVDVARWRKAERERLITQRLAPDAITRADYARRIAERLSELIGDPPGRVVSVYWPFRGEPDLRIWSKEVLSRGGRTALPVVVAKQTPLIFRLWRQGDRLARGVWNSPIPADGEEVTPDIVIAPVVGFDAGCFRLGYGGGFFDRTLAVLPKPVTAIATDPKVILEDAWMPITTTPSTENSLAIR